MMLMKSVALTLRRLWPCLVLLASSRALAFDIEDLQALIRDEQLDTVAGVVERLPAEYRENYALAYESQSLQGASYRNPRAILFGETASLVLTFNGHPEQRDYESIEAMQFREGRETFELYSLDFSAARPELSGPNPQVCASCHGSPPHPIWSSYEYGDRETSHWPGMYGSSHDAPLRVEKEAAAFRRFVEHAQSHPRYRHLKTATEQAPWYPYGSGPLQHRLRPNNRLGNLLARWHARQITALIDQSLFVDRYPAVSRAWLLQCPGIDQPAYRKRVQRLFDRHYPPAGHRLVHDMLDGLPAGRRVALMMERLLTGYDTFGWDMSIEKPENHGRFFTGITTIDRLVGAHWLATRDADHPLKPYFEPWGSRQLYNTFQEGYYRSNVAPGGVGRAYDSVATYYDESRARQACPEVMGPLLAAGR